MTAMNKPGHAKAGGREKGTPNRRTQELWAALEKAGMNTGNMPAVALFKVYTGQIRFEQYIDGWDIDPAIDPNLPLKDRLAPTKVKVLEPASAQLRVTAMKECAKYVHNALSSVHLVDDEGNTLAPTMVDYATLVKAIEAKEQGQR